MASFKDGKTQNLSLRPLCALGVSAVGMPVKEVHRRDAEYAKEKELKLGHHHLFCGKGQSRGARMVSLIANP